MMCAQVCLLLFVVAMQCTYSNGSHSNSCFSSGIDGRQYCLMDAELSDNSLDCMGEIWSDSMRHEVACLLSGAVSD